MSQELKRAGHEQKVDPEIQNREREANLTASQLDEKETAVALILASLRLRLERNYRTVFEDYFERWKSKNPSQDNQKKILSCQKLLISSDGKQILELIWKESSHIPEMSMAISGHQKSLFEVAPSITDLAEAIISNNQMFSETDYRTGTRVRQRIQRVVEAAEFLGLVTRPPGRGGTARPVYAEASLHLIMKQVHKQNASEVAQLVPSIKRPNGDQ